MTDFEIGLLVFVCVFGGALAGMFLGWVLLRLAPASPAQPS